MGEVTTYPHGAFCWIDLGTTDVAGTKPFYEGVLGWEFVDVPAGPDETYTLCRVGGKEVAGMHRHSEDEGVGWSSYICVDDVDAATKRARELGAQVVAGPLDIPGSARMAVIRDPGGAEVALWQPMGFNGARLVNDEGAWIWNELLTRDIEAVKAFYRELVGWNAMDVPAPMPRVSFVIGDLLIGAAHAPTEGERDAPSGWTVTFRVANADETAERVAQLGGSVLLAPMDLPVGRFAKVSDPTGATFTITSLIGEPFGNIDRT